MDTSHNLPDRNMAMSRVVSIQHFIKQQTDTKDYEIYGLAA
jgi:hypothetical protein